MTTPDLNLLVTLDVLLTEGSVARAALRLGLSPSAMSRALARLRDTIGDPLLVRAGRGLVPTPRALELREEVHHLVEGVTAALRPAGRLDLASLSRVFTIRISDGTLESFGTGLVPRINAEAPGVLLRFLPRTERDGRSLRDGGTDLELGVVGATMSPEIRAQALVRDRFVGVVRATHPLAGRITTPEAYCQCDHVSDSRHERDGGPMQMALQARGLRRIVRVVVSGFGTAIALAATSDLLATVPETRTRNLGLDMHVFPLPFDTTGITVSMMWHPRLDVDPAHRWLRQMVRDICGGQD